MLQTFKIVLKYIVIISLILLIIFFLKTTLEDQKEVIRIGDEKIKMSEVDAHLNKKYWNQAVNEVVNQKLIQNAGEKGKLLNISLQEIEEEAALLEKSHDPRSDISKQSNLDYIKRRVLIKNLAKNYTITENELKNFINEKDGIKEATYIVDIYEGTDHELVSNLEIDLNKGKSQEEVSKQYKIAFTQKEFRQNNIYKINLEQLGLGAIQHIHQGEKHGILIVKEIKVTEVTTKLDNKSKVKIMDSYLETKYFKEELDVINYLRSQQSIVVDLDGV